MRRERLTFPGAFGDELAAILERPASTPASWALFAHCFTCSKDLKAVGRISRALVERGIAVLRFDFTGLGESAGEFAGTNFSSNLDDLAAAADFLRRRYRAPSLLIGHSLGGAAVLAVADRIPEATAIATLGAPSDTTHLRDQLLAKAPELTSGEADPAAAVEVELAGRRFEIRRQLIDDLGTERVLDAVRGLGRALLVLHSPRDEVVGIEHARRIYDAALHPRSFVSLDDADHLLLREPSDARYVAEVLAAWASRYVAVAEKQAKSETPTEDGQVVVRSRGDGLTQDIHAGRHLLVADEPERLGGSDRGPTPYDLLLAALGACTSMTLRMYARRKGWPLTGVEVRLGHRHVHAEDCAECETEEGRIDLVERTVEIAGELDEAQRARLLEIAGRCPVHRTLTSPTEIHDAEP